MEVQDGFIVGVYNYCDRWCEITDFDWLMREIDALIPKARAFVRPGFDEPDEVRKLEAIDWS
jgi:hypothetical protein